MGELPEDLAVTSRELGKFVLTVTLLNAFFKRSASLVIDGNKTKKQKKQSHIYFLSSREAIVHDGSLASLRSRNLVILVG